jgi:hypothetical protein
MSSYPADVAEVRAFAMGPAITPLTDAFPGDVGSDFAAWCWTKRDSRGFISYVVDIHRHRVRVLVENGSGGTPQPGMPTVG